ncbi:MAG: glycosyltransferase family 4 protein [Phycisphaerae bacterium]
MSTDVVFINSSGDTFTPTHSGSLGPWVWEVCRAAQAADGVCPLVISKDNGCEPFPWSRTTLMPWPVTRRTGPVARLARRVHRKVTGWGVAGLSTFARRVGDAIEAAGAGDATLFLQNDPELTVYLRRRFPAAFIVCHFQNEHVARPPFRRAVGLSANVVTACSGFTARRIERIYGLAGRGGVVPLHSGVDAARCAPAPAAPGEVPVINYTGRLGPDKAPDLLLRAARRVARHTASFKLQLVGVAIADGQNDPYTGEVRHLIGGLRAAGVEVRIPGLVDRWHIASEYQRAHVHVMPSRWDEPFGLVTLEGMACGLATVAARTGGTPEVVGDAALGFDRDDEGALAEHLRRLVTDAAFRRARQEAARDRALEFPWAKTWGEIRRLRDRFAPADVRPVGRPAASVH